MKATHDAQGNRMQYMNDNGTDQTIAEMLRAERMGQTSSYDEVMAGQIARDATFKDDLDYMDEKAEKLSNKKQPASDKNRALMVNGNDFSCVSVTLGAA
jgi:hypothetical protein